MLAVGNAAGVVPVLEVADTVRARAAIAALVPAAIDGVTVGWPNPPAPGDSVDGPSPAFPSGRPAAADQSKVRGAEASNGTKPAVDVNDEGNVDDAIGAGKTLSSPLLPLPFKYAA